MALFHQPVFPFSAIVGQDDMKLALLLNAVNPRVGGVLLRGEKGTAKSTAVRSLSRLLSEPFVNVPLNITEDRFSGGIDVSGAVKNGVITVMKGVASEAHGGFLYVDEINLLSDHIVDIMLHTASAGRVNLQREGLNAFYPASFVPVGSMNPEEGELRPQLLDKFGLAVYVESSPSVMERVLLMENRELFDRDTEAFCRSFEKEDESLKKRIHEARRILKSVKIGGEAKSRIAAKVLEANAAGHRADIVMAEAAMSFAAWRGAYEVSEGDIDRVSEFALLHRRNDAPPYRSEPESKGGESGESGGEGKTGKEHEKGSSERTDESAGGNSGASTERPSEGGETVFGISEPFSVRPIFSEKDRKRRSGGGRRSKTKTDIRRGRCVRALNTGGKNDLAIEATLRAAAPYQKYRTPPEGMAWAIEPQDIREKEREKRSGNFILFIVDASGSMGARGRMAAAKGAVVSLLLDAYQKRDKVAMISFRGGGSRVVLHPTSSVELAEKKLRQLPSGGKTPLSAGLYEGRRLVEGYLKKDPLGRPIVILLTDGKANVPLMEGANPREESREIAAQWARDSRVRFIVVDTERKGLVEFSLAETLASSLRTVSLAINDLKADTLLSAIKRSINE